MVDECIQMGYPFAFSAVDYDAEQLRAQLKRVRQSGRRTYNRVVVHTTTDRRNQWRLVLKTFRLENLVDSFNRLVFLQASNTLRPKNYRRQRRQ